MVAYALRKAYAEGGRPGVRGRFQTAELGGRVPSQICVADWVIVFDLSLRVSAIDATNARTSNYVGSYLCSCPCVDSSWCLP